jgi:hypothetical protein
MKLSNEGGECESALASISISLPRNWDAGWFTGAVEFEDCISFSSRSASSSSIQSKAIAEKVEG